MNIEEILDAAEAASDMKREALYFVLESFILAHDRARGGLSLEFGTREGGSALLQLLLINDLYKRDERPFLFTVDPYGGKPYQGGDPDDGPGRALYGDDTYVKMKRLLAGFPNHAHYYMESLRFLKIAPWLGYWSRSHCCFVKDLTFALLDGEHTAEAISTEIQELLPFMNPKGLIVIDNFDRDNRVPQALSRYERAIEFGSTAQPGELQLRIRMEKI